MAVTMVSVRRRRCDDDNLVAACKPLRDAIAATLGVDDGDPRIQWRCEQIIGSPVGVVVLIALV